MGSLAEKYHYIEKNIQVPEQQYLDDASEIKNIGRIIIPSGLTIDGTSIDYDVITYKTPRFTYILLTAIDTSSHIPLGFRDVRVNEGMMSWGDCCFGRRGEQLPKELLDILPDNNYGIPYPSIRFSQESMGGAHGFAVKESFQGKGLGKGMLFTVFEIEQRIGVKEHVINEAYDDTFTWDQNNSKDSYYIRLGARSKSPYEFFDLNNPEENNE